ncbi:4a-hydroxytetrahydrobiopterin dehydratase [Paenibacillaceae bacterium WGS1546]|uniref:4a-hydroxytetrahydrobiopterin dehydratase n=1 Tax=Cohnella sp. WGS1546 TaxID=3366810 RepID=UPI00372D51F3
MGKLPVLTEAELAEGMQALKGWKIEEDGKWMIRTRLFPSFAEAVAFVNRVAEVAEAMNHHPFIGIDYRRVTLRLTTWHSGGLTALDLRSAEAYDRL